MKWKNGLVLTIPLNTFFPEEYCLVTNSMSQYS